MPREQTPAPAAHGRTTSKDRAQSIVPRRASPPRHPVPEQAQLWEAFMANEEHVALLKQGGNAWNAWRRQNPDLRPDLRGADLRGADLSEAKLDGAVLIETNLEDANL